MDPVGTDLIAILRGLSPSDGVQVGAVLYGAGFRVIEVPLNSPDPFATIRLLRESLPPDAIVGAGTVLRLKEVQQCQQAGAEIIVSPNTDRAVIAETLALGLQSYPGCATPSEAFRAIDAGAQALKLFPARQVGIAGLKAWRDVLPQGMQLIPVGGVKPSDFREWRAAGATGFGIGSALYTPGLPLKDLAERAQTLMQAWAASAPSKAGGTAE